MDVVMLRMPPEVLAVVARMQIVSPIVANSVVEISGPRMVSAQISAETYENSLSELAQSIRNWVFANAATQASTLAVASTDSTHYLSLAPNVSTSIVRQALEKAIRNPAFIDVR